MKVEDELTGVWITRDPTTEQTKSRRKSISLLESLESLRADAISAAAAVEDDSREDISAGRLQLPVKRFPPENPTIKDNNAEDESFIGDVNFILPRSSHHSLPDTKSLKFSARRTSNRSKARQTCYLIMTFFISNIQLCAILGLSTALLVVLLHESRGDDTVTVARLRSGGYNTSPQHIESVVRGYVEREHQRHPDILGDALLHDLLSSQGKALQKTVQARRSIDDVSSAIDTYVLWTINYQLFGNEVHDDGVTAGVWSSHEVGDVCLWRGVQCDDRGNVAVLDLEDRDVEGDLPSEVYLLKESLTGLNLKDNIEMGQNGMPTFLNQMTKLNYLNMCGTAYHGLDDVSTFCASGAGKLIYADFDCECCVSCT